MKKTMTPIAVILWVALTASADVFYVSQSGSDTTGTGSPSTPYKSLTNAYLLLCQHDGGGEVHVLPGTYSYNSTIVLSNGLVSIKGSSLESTTIGSDTTLFITNEPCCISDVCIEGMVTNTVCAYLSNVKLVQPAFGTNVVGVWREDGTPDVLNVRGLMVPRDKTDASSKEYSDGLTNSLVTQSDQRYYKAGSPISGSLVFSATGESNTVENMSLQQVGLAAILWFPENGAFNVKEKNTGGTGDRLSIQSQTIYAFRPLEMRGNRIQNVAEPQDSTDSATRNYVDSKVYGDANIGNDITIDPSGSVDGGAIKSGTVGEGYIAASLARDSELTAATGSLGQVMLNKTGDTMTGVLTINTNLVTTGTITTPSLVVTGTNAWYVGNNSCPSVPVHLVMVSNGGELQSLYDLRLRAANGEIQFKSPVKFEAGINEAGRAGRTNNATTSGSGCTITVPSCTPNSVVLITPTTNTAPANFWVEAVSNSFTVKSTDTNVWSFNYLVR